MKRSDFSSKYENDADDDSSPRAAAAADIKLSFSTSPEFKADAKKFRKQAANEVVKWGEDDKEEEEEEEEEEDDGSFRKYLKEIRKDSSSLHDTEEEG